jgi:hypothetical protein
MAEAAVLNSTIAAARDRLPANFAGLRAILTTVEGIGVTHEFGCRCGGTTGIVRATPVDGESDYLDPVSFECATCGHLAAFFDSSRDGYEGLLNGGACYEQGADPQIVACSLCGNAATALTCELLYNTDFADEDEGQLELLANAQNYFDCINIQVRCPSCNVARPVGQWELA